MDNSIRRGSFEMTAAMLISGTIGWFVLVSGQPVLDVVFWRCVIGAPVLLVVCAALSMLRGTLTPRLLAFAALGGVAIVLNWLLLFAAYSRASIAIATAVYNTQPFILDAGDGLTDFPGDEYLLVNFQRPVFTLAILFGLNRAGIR